MTGTIREAVATMLDLQPDIEVVATAADGSALVSAVAETAPDVVLTDLRMPGVDGAAAIRAAAAGQSVLDRSVQQRLLAAMRPPGTTDTPPSRSEVTGVGSLTARERDVVVHMADGLSNREIAAALFVSESTAKTHINNAFAKLDVRDRAQAVALAYRSGIARS